MANSQRRLQTILGHLKGGDGAAILPNPAAAHAASSIEPSRSGRYRYTIDSTSAGVLSAERRDFYEKNGYVVIPGLVPQEKLDRYRERFRQICSREVNVPGLAIMRDVAIAKSEFRADERAVTKIQDFQVLTRLNKFGAIDLVLLRWGEWVWLVVAKINAKI